MKKPADGGVMVLRDDPAAATFVTVQGWRSRRGFFYGEDEDMARYDGCTHVRCSRCGNPTEKSYTACQPCRSLAEQERYAAMPRAEWDGESMVYSQTLDRYFSTPGDAEDELEEGQTLGSLRLVLCTPNRGRRIDADHFAEELPEDGDLPDVLTAAIAAFNAAVDEAPVLSWSPGKVALACEEEVKTGEPCTTTN